MNQAEILLTVGTDFHQFDRVIQWLDRWLELNPGWQGKALCQHGASEPPVLARGVDYLDNDTLLASMRQARAVITHGGQRPSSRLGDRTMSRCACPDTRRSRSTSTATSNDSRGSLRTRGSCGSA